MEQNEKVIDISDTNILSYGAECVAAVLSLCDQLQEIRLNNCGIRDKGAIALFSELKNTPNVSLLELSDNPITEKSFDSLLELLRSNEGLVRVDLRGIKVKSKLALSRLKPFAERVHT